MEDRRRFLGKVAGTVAKTVGAVAPGPAGAVLRTVGGALSPVRAPTGFARSVPAPSLPIMGPPQGQQPRGRTPYLGLPVLDKPKRRRMNYGNTKALKRADRRIDGFVKVARSALKHTNYKVVSKSAGRSSRNGSRGVITRAEAARALSR